MTGYHCSKCGHCADASEVRREFVAKLRRLADEDEKLSRYNTMLVMRQAADELESDMVLIASTWAVRIGA